MNEKDISDALEHMIGDKTLSNKRIHQYTNKKDGIINVYDFVTMYEKYIMNQSAIKTNQTNSIHRKLVKKLVRSEILSEEDLKFFRESLTNISDNHMPKINVNSRIVKTEKSKKLFNV